MKSPTVATLKRLFAVSSNRCAFPKCAEPLVHEGKVTGRACHIKGDRPGSARYDETQADEERHSFENLILLCPIHHDVIDADEIAYSVERLHKLKASHEAQTISPPDLSDSDAQQLLVISLAAHAGASVVINNNQVSSTNQSGGITAHTVNQTFKFTKPRRVMGDGMKRTILDECPRDKTIVIWSISGDEETQVFAQQIFDFMKANGFRLFGTGPSPNIYLGPQPKGVTFKPGDQFNDVIVGYCDGSEQPFAA
jgi:hypothetical protein